MISQISGVANVGWLFICFFVFFLYVQIIVSFLKLLLLVVLLHSIVGVWHATGIPRSVSKVWVRGFHDSDFTVILLSIYFNAQYQGGLTSYLVFMWICFNVGKTYEFLVFSFVYTISVAQIKWIGFIYIFLTGYLNLLSN